MNSENQIPRLKLPTRLPVSTSPWRAELPSRAAHPPIDSDLKADVVIVGGGLAGILTARAILKSKPDRKITIVEQEWVASGATGNNAGHFVAEPEQPMTHMRDTLGIDTAQQVQFDYISGWRQLQQVVRETGNLVPVTYTQSLDWVVSEDHLREYAEETMLMYRSGIRFRRVYLNHPTSDPTTNDLQRYGVALRQSPQTAPNNDWYAAVSLPVAVLNSALLTEQMSQHLLTTYPNRFTVNEHSPVSALTVQREAVYLHTNNRIIKSDQVILCTNGYTRLSIEDFVEPHNNTFLSNNIQPSIGYMAGYVIPGQEQPPSANSYYETGEADEYLYETRRKVIINEADTTLLVIGGPEKSYSNGYAVSGNERYSHNAGIMLKEAVERRNTQGAIEAYRWKGVMGYTPHDIRIIGALPTSPRLVYNVGCNGIALATLFAAAEYTLTELSGSAQHPYKPEQLL